MPRFTVKRTAAFPMCSLSLHPDLRKEMFLAHNRFNSFLKKVDWGQVNSLGGHSFWGIVPDDCKSMREFRDKHPEMMALAKNGKRRPDQHCYTNPKTVRLFVDWICKFWEEHPDCELLGLSPVDTPVYCTCEECAKHGWQQTKSVHEKAPRETERIYAYRLSAYCLGRLLWDPDADLERIEGD